MDKTQTFIEKSKQIYGDKYTYENTIVINCKSKIKITCKEHGEFEQYYSNHIKGHNGCRFCVQKENRTDYNSFIEKSNKIHNYKYDYSLISPNKPIPKKVIIICPIHGEFIQTPYRHSLCDGCQKCSKNKKDNRESFIEKSNKKHNNKFDYSLVEYIDSSTKVKITCPTHGIFEMAPSKHIIGQQCRGCSNRVLITKEVFIEKSSKQHCGKYDYSFVNFKNSEEKVDIICPIHGEFKQNARYHMNGQGCPICANNIPYTLDRFILSANHIHENKYNYSKVEFKTVTDRVVIICPIHGEFKQRVEKHVHRMQGCPHCHNVSNESRGSKKIKKYLQSINIPFVPEFRFDDCKNKNTLPFDFKIIINNKLALIEFNGEQHFKESGWQPLEYIQYNDKIKRDYCRNKNIPLLDINYNEEQLIPEKINTFINMLRSI